MNATKVLGTKEIRQKMKRIAWQVYEHNFSEKELVIVGIADRGLKLAQQLADNIKDISAIETKIAHIGLDKKDPYNKEVTINIDEQEYTNKVVILVDDVLNSGKTLMYAAKHFLNTPLIKLATVVLVDRNHNRYPIKADYVGLSLATTLQEYINVSLEGEEQGVYLS